MAAIRIEDVTKTFGVHTAVDGLSLEVPEGSIYGFIGPNGSGKTTTLRMIMNILLPDRGRIEVLGRQDLRAANDRLGYLPEERSLYKKMKVSRVLRYFGELKGLGGPELGRAIATWLERFDLVEWGERKVETLSKGMSQKVQFIATVLHRPDLVILDEPFSGLDPVNTDALREAVLELGRSGATVVFSTHDMDMAERLCDVIFMIFKGHKVLDAPLDEIQAEYGADTVRLRLGGDGTFVGELPGVAALTDYGRYQEVRVEGDRGEFLRALAERAEVYRYEVTRPSLRDIFVRIAGPEAEEVEHA